PRLPWDGGWGWDSLPRSVSVTRWTSDTDVPETRFVRYVLEVWREFTGRVHDVLRAERSSPAVERGLRETAATLDELDALLAEPLLRSVGRLAYLPLQSQVLQRR